MLCIICHEKCVQALDCSSQSHSVLQCGTVGDDGVVMPPPLPLTSERLERHGLHLIEDGQNIFLWVGRDAVPQLIQDVFDLPSISELRGGKATLPVLDNSFSQRVNAIVGKVRESRRGPYCLFFGHLISIHVLKISLDPHLYICKEDGEPSLRMWALSALIEDRQEPAPSYNQFLQTIKGTSLRERCKTVLSYSLADKVNGTS